MNQVEKLTNNEFNELKAISLFLGVYKSEINFNEVVPNVMFYIANKYNEELIYSNDFKIEDLKTNFDLIKTLFTLTDKALDGSKEAKEIALEIISTIDIKDIPKSARMGALLEIDPREENFTGMREKTILKALNENEKFRQMVDIYNLEVYDIGVKSWLRSTDSLLYNENDKDKPLLVESYTGGNKNCVIFINRNIKTKNIIGFSTNYNHSKIDNNSVEARKPYIASVS